MRFSNHYVSENNPPATRRNAYKIFFSICSKMNDLLLIRRKKNIGRVTRKDELNRNFKVDCMLNKSNKLNLLCNFT
jgi:hypothetical protein